MNSAYPKNKCLVWCLSRNMSRSTFWCWISAFGAKISFFKTKTNTTTKKQQKQTNENQQQQIPN